MNRNPAILLSILLLSFVQSWGAALQMQEELLWYAVDYANTTSNGQAEDWQQKSTRIDVDVPAGRVGTAYDPIGNRKFSLTDEDITAGHDGDYTSNSLNQYILRRTGEGFSVSGFVDSADASRSAGAAVAVLNSQGEYEFAMLENYELTDEGYFWAKLSKSAPTETEARFEQIRTYGALAGTYASALDGPQNADEADAIGYKDELLLVPPKIQGFAYDADGNLLTDNLWAYEYDAENRPVRIYRGTSAAPFEALTFVYDYLGRRVKKTYHNSTDPTRNYTIAFLWQGWSLLAELRTNGTVKRSFDWGLDLSASIGGAGGIGALLAMHDHDQGQTHLFSYDANGNVSALINRSSAEVSAAYEYDPFGNLVRKTGSYADSNPFRFSTKYYDSESRLSYFGFRYYSPDLGRFINQDLIEEQGAWVLYNTLSTSTTTPLAGAPTIGASDLRSTWQERQDSLLSAFMTTYGSEMVGIAGKRNSTDSTTRFAGTTAFSANASTHFTITPRLPQSGASDFSLPSGGYSGPSNIDINLYAFTGNNPINGYDSHGLYLEREPILATHYAGELFRDLRTAWRENTQVPASIDGVGYGEKYRISKFELNFGIRAGKSDVDISNPKDNWSFSFFNASLDFSATEKFDIGASFDLNTGAQHRFQAKSELLATIGDESGSGSFSYTYNDGEGRFSFDALTVESSSGNSSGRFNSWGTVGISRKIGPFTLGGELDISNLIKDSIDAVFENLGDFQESMRRTEEERYGDY